MRIDRFDARDDEAWAAWYATYRSSDLFERPHANPYASGEMRERVLHRTSGEQEIAFAGVDESGVVATATLGLTFKDNVGLAFVELHVRPDARRRGLGSAMLARLEREALELGREVVLVEAHYPYELDEAGTGSAGAEFLLSHGYRFALGSITRTLPLPVDPGFLIRIRDECEPYHRGYSFRQYAGRAPDDLVEGVGRMIGLVGVEAPLGDLELEEEVFDVDRMHDDERQLAAMGRRRYVTVAVDGSGAPVAFTDLIVASQDDGKVYQWGTLVLAEHRGHRLGMALKVRNLEFLQAQESGARVLVTDNAGANDHMVGINERLGFRPVERTGEFQKRL